MPLRAFEMPEQAHESVDPLYHEDDRKEEKEGVHLSRALRYCKTASPKISSPYTRKEVVLSFRVNPGSNVRCLTAR